MSGARTVKTRVLVISDTHGYAFPDEKLPQQEVDLAIHCGDLTHHSKLDEMHATLDLLRKLNAPLKLVIAGNHDFTLDKDAYHEKLEEAYKINPELRSDKALVEKEFGTEDTARDLLLQAKKDGIIFLDEGNHQITLKNGAVVKVYASPYTPSPHVWGFTYSGTHEFEVNTDTDIAITHGPPRGVMDMNSSDKKRIGCPQLFTAIAKAQPRVHCFGHVHKGWGAKLASWRAELPENLSHFSAFDNEKSEIIDNLAKLAGSQFESGEEKQQRLDRLSRLEEQRCYEISAQIPQSGSTLFVNAALEDADEIARLPWLFEIDLPLREMREIEVGEDQIVPDRSAPSPPEENDSRQLRKRRLSSSSEHLESEELASKRIKL